MIVEAPAAARDRNWDVHDTPEEVKLQSAVERHTPAFPSDFGMQKAVKKIALLLNRVVVFSTSRHSYLIPRASGSSALPARYETQIQGTFITMPTSLFRTTQRAVPTEVIPNTPPQSPLMAN
jgi:hypothetical protein